jgi:hypothetical protein
MAAPQRRPRLAAGGPLRSRGCATPLAALALALLVGAAHGYPFLFASRFVSTA